MKNNSQVRVYIGPMRHSQVAIPLSEAWQSIGLTMLDVGLAWQISNLFKEPFHA